MKTPKWVSAIPQAPGHGSGILQKKLWRLCSDAVRIRDWHQYKKCVATGDYIAEWRDSDAGHWRPYSTCNGLFKFDIWNIHMQSKKSNAWGGMKDGYYFGEELKRRYGETFLDELEQENRNHTSEKLSTELIIQEMTDILDFMSTLPEQPDYYARVMKLLNEERN